MAGNITQIHPNIGEKYFNYLVGITTSEAAKVCDIHIKTARRYQKENSWPLRLRRLVLLHGGMLSQEGWEGWQIHAADNKLYCPDLKYGFTPSDVKSLHYLKQRCEHLERIVSKMSE
jgi:hypothetical protein